MRERRVVTAFLESGGKILILKRSGKVSTYTHHWAGVSGSIAGDESPDARVRKEIEEETGLPPEAVQFIRKGKPLRVEDGDTLWTVYPFLYHVPEPEQIRTDWEHVEKRWIAPDALAAYQTVPNLKDTLDRVYLEEAVAAPIADIEADREHGAAELASMALEVLKKAVEQESLQGPEECFAHLSNVGWHLRNVRPSMTPLTNAIAFVLYHAKQRLSQAKGITDFRKNVATIVDQYRTNSRNAAQVIAQNAHALLSDKTTILTHSYSSTVVEAILGVCQQDLHIIVTEARPLNEGIKTAKRLSKKYPVTLITDAQAGYFMQQADVVLIGADTILPDGAVVNKAGTYLIALAAQKQNVPVYALCQTDKFHTEGAIALEEKESREIISEALPDVTVRNIYFELTPAELINGIVTERGIMKSTDVLSFVEQMENYVKVWE
ncbi:MAG: NUDIX domain-containing protein [Candidatus Poribacteria bacterium]|nr:NUDIX domain-containing protein [Candidatus Poribacteria bacterium]